MFENIHSVAESIRCVFSHMSDIMLIALPFCIIGGFIMGFIEWSSKK